MRSVSSTLVGVSLEFEIATNCVSTWAMRTILWSLDLSRRTSSAIVSETILYQLSLLLKTELYVKCSDASISSSLMGLFWPRNIRFPFKYSTRKNLCSIFVLLII